MSLEEILKDIELRGKKEIDELTLYYEKRVSDLKSKQDSAIRAQSERIRKASDEERRTAERTITSSAEMQALNSVRAKEGALIDEAVGKAELFLKGMRERRDYPETLSKMVEIAQKALGAGCLVYASREDLKLLKPGSYEAREREVDPYGGIVAESSDGSRELDMRLSSLISEIRERLVSQFYEFLGE